YREYTGDLGHPLLYAFVPDHALLSDDDSHTQLLNCNLFDALDYKFQLSSLPDLKHESYQIDGDLNFAKKEKMKYKLSLDEIEFNDSDYDSELSDIGIQRTA
ncbi:unnamed protein product, partial [Rotaria socialis]